MYVLPTFLKDFVEINSEVNAQEFLKHLLRNFYKILKVVSVL